MTSGIPVPVIDIGGFLDGTDLTSAPSDIGVAATTTGFFQIVGHGIEPDLIDRAYDVAHRLAALPDEVKRTLTSPTGHPYRGLMLNYEDTGRLCSEGFTVCRFDGPDEAITHGVAPDHADYFVANVWPDVPGFRETMTELSGRTRALGRQLMRIFAVALELPADYFDGCTELDATTSTIRSYPARHAPPPHNPTVIFDEHFDGGVLTMLHQRGTYEGLQIRTLSGEWFPVPIVEDGFVINMGELMTRWTNGNWPATRHRVVAAEDPEGYRFTLPTFYMPAVDTLIAPLPTQGAPKYEPVTVYKWLTRHIVKSYEERQHTKASPATEAFVAGLDAAAR